MENIIVVYGGKSCESDISVITALSIISSVKSVYRATLVYLKDGRFFIGKALSDITFYRSFDPKKCKEVTFKKGRMFRKKLFDKGEKVDCALVCCHGGQGENGSLSGYFEIAGVPYTCCGPLQSAVCMDKTFTKYLLQYFHFPSLPFRIYKKGDEVALPSDYPVIVKPASLGSSIGIGIAENEEQLSKRIETALQFDEKLLLEKALVGRREFTCAVMTAEGNVVCSQIEEVIAPEEFYSFDEKYGMNETKRVYPAQVAPLLEAKIYKISKRIYRLFELKGAVRIDFLEKDGKLFVNEINTVPGSLSWYLFKNVGYDLSALCRCLITDAIKRKEKENLLFTDFKSDVLNCFSACGKGSGKYK